MALPTAAQLKEIEGRLFLFKFFPTALPIPKNNDPQFTTRMQPVATNPRFQEISFGVVDFTADRMNPKVFLHEGGTPWRMGSTGKIAVLLAAAQLREDVRQVKAVPGLVMSPAEFDNVFSTIWKNSVEDNVKKIAGKGPPRVSTTIDVSISQPDFIEAGVPLNKSLVRTDGHGGGGWPKMPDISFRDRLWLAGAQSDNFAANACISEIGVAYMTAVQRAYGLFIEDKTKGMRMLLAGGYYGGVPQNVRVRRAASAPTYRPLFDLETRWTNDKLIDKAGKLQPSDQGGSVAALTAYMIALIQDKLVNKDGCDAIKLFLADELPSTNPGSLVRGVADIKTIQIKTAHAKGGALNKETGAVQPLRCDVAYIETAPIGGGAGKKFAIVAQGLLPVIVAGSEVEPEVQGQELAKAIHNAL
jgi:hypothetical protein